MTTRHFRAAVVGATGYGGGEIIRRLLMHPNVELSRVVSIEHVGEPIASAHPNLEGASHHHFVDMDPREAAEQMDVVFFGLPHDVSARTVPDVLSSSDAKVIDLSGAFRCSDAVEYERWYGTRHPAPEWLSEFVYGLPELNREAIRGARCVANPGCFATSIELGVLPYARKGWLREGLRTVAMTGSSGSGASASSGTHHPIRALNLKTYKALEHPQQLEILATLRKAGAGEVELSFVPVSAPLSRGILATTFALIPEEVSSGDVMEALRESYAESRFTRVPKGRLPEVAAVSGSNFAEVGVVPGSLKDSYRELVCLTALDNLVKGGAGQAIQNMNLVLGLDEGLALEDFGSWP